MGLISEQIPLPDGFDGTVRLFPLPDLVFFPRMILPLHVFEPRYCSMLQEAMATDQLITMATLQGTTLEPDQIHSHVCLGRLIAHETTGNGTHNIVLGGAARARITQELQTDLPFRKAKVTILEETEEENRALHQSLCEELLSQFTGKGEGIQRIEQMVKQGAMSLGTMTDLFSFYSQLSTSFKLELLEEQNPRLRAEMLLRATRMPTHREFPPPFSEN